MKTLAACTLASCSLLAACAAPDAAEPGPGALAPAWVEFGPVPIVRTAVPAHAGCPDIEAEGRTVPMTLRVAAGTPARRQMAGDPGATNKPPAFPVDVCEAALPPQARHLALAGHALPVPVAQPHRIVVLGDTGCRLKGEAMQDCADPSQWPFAQVASAAAAQHPDLVVHVGDYHYRETPCPATAGCAASPWGYGWDVWKADFFDPAAPLLAAAPWVFVRGNHEECRRAGQGWFRFLAPGPWLERRSCDRPADDADADFTAPYAVPLAADLQLVVFDSAVAGYEPLDRSRERDAATWARYVAQFRDVASLAARPGVRTIFASHHPILGFAPADRPGDAPLPGTASLLQTAGDVDGNAYLPPGVVLALHGHVHLFEAIGFDDGHPATFVAGNGGDLRDDALPAALPPGTEPAPGTHVASFTTSREFGFLLLEPGDAGAWRTTVFRRDGSVLARCAPAPGASLACEPAGPAH
jgi:hypothetical protein